MAVLSLVLTALSVLTFWLVVPLFVLPPLAFFLGYKAYKARRAKLVPAGRFGQLLSVLPMALAVAAFCLELYVMNVGYRA
ncbi:hypothetical protein [Rugamonas rivuli]|uniref:Uncharacterized protein n=1 Tax=Rugamonas rivuli TaxID=2743358 RepID=A0A843S748_9BURK|nr:hypothetical protein [Rugamonas rivuli]MQA20215.1 hypothetical protein [Rugamonas rivuli]